MVITRLKILRAAQISTAFAIIPIHTGLCPDGLSLSQNWSVYQAYRSASQQFDDPIILHHDKRNENRLTQIERHFLLNGSEILALVPETFASPDRGLVKNAHDSGAPFVSQLGLLDDDAELRRFSDFVRALGPHLFLQPMFVIADRIAATSLHS